MFKRNLPMSLFMTTDKSELIDLKLLLEVKDIQNIRFTEHVVFISSIDLANIKGIEQNLKNIEFKNCIFEKGFKLNFKFNYSHKIDLTLKLSFTDCFIKAFVGDSQFPATVCSDVEAKSIRFELCFNVCLIQNIELIHCDFDSVDFFKCIMFPYSLTIRDCQIKVIRIFNCLGTQSILGCYYSIVNLDFNDAGLRIERRKPINDAVRDISNQRAIKKIYFLETRLTVENCLKCSIRFDKFPLSGIVRDKSNPSIRRAAANYYLTEADLEMLNISVYIKMSLVGDAEFSISDAILNNFSLSGKISKSVKVRKLRANNVFIREFSTSEAEFTGISSRAGDKKFEIAYSELEHVWFNKFNLNSFLIVSFYHSTIEKARFSSTKFPKEILSVENVHYPEKKNDDYAEEIYENYRQLKATLINSGDFVGALAMHAKMYNAISRSKHLGRQDKVILCLNRVSNNHSTSIHRAFILAILLILIFHFLNIIAFTNAPYSWGWEGNVSFLKAIGDNFNFAVTNNKLLFVIANPAHQLEDLAIGNDDSFVSGGNYAVSFFSRIFLAWAYYQFIMAFRKFGKV